MARVCDRCGVPLTIPGQWCIDCIDVESPDSIWDRGGAPSHGAFADEKAQAIRDYWLSGYTDLQTAESLGISRKTVLRWRKRLNLPATNHGGFHYKSEEAKETILRTAHLQWKCTPATSEAMKK